MLGSRPMLAYQRVYTSSKRTGGADNDYAVCSHDARRD